MIVSDINGINCVNILLNLSIIQQPETPGKRGKGADDKPSKKFKESGVSLIWVL